MPKLKDLTGQRFGKLVVVGRHHENLNGAAAWDCVCDCGSKAVVRGRALSSGATKTCGCSVRRYDQMVGERFGVVTVTQVSSRRRGKAALLCYICDCGRSGEATRPHLLNGYRSSCGSQCGLRSLEGRRFGSLVVRGISDERTTSGAFCWDCVCDCGGEASISGARLKSGSVQFCGRDCGLRDLSAGDRFGSLVVARRVTPVGEAHSGVRYECICDCGETAVRLRKSLTHDSHSHCGGPAHFMSKALVALARRVRCAVRRSLADAGARAGNGAIRHLDYSPADLAAHLERQFLPGMGWHNMSEWHVDHVVPVADFDIRKEGDDEFLACWSLANLRPLWASDNISKSDNREFLL